MALSREQWNALDPKRRDDTREEFLFIVQDATADPVAQDIAKVVLEILDMMED